MNVYIMYVENSPYYTHSDIKYIVAAMSEKKAMEFTSKISGNSSWMDDDMTSCELIGVEPEDVKRDDYEPFLIWERDNTLYEHSRSPCLAEEFNTVNFLMRQIKQKRDNGELRATILNESMWVCLLYQRFHIQDMRKDIDYLCSLVNSAHPHLDLSEVLLTLDYKLEK